LRRGGALHRNWPRRRARGRYAGKKSQAVAGPGRAYKERGKAPSMTGCLSCGNYQLLHLVGKGGFAEVYLGEHIYLKTRAAIKILHTRFEEENQRRFLEEARLIARLEHPHIVRVLDFGLEGELPYLVMDYAPLGSVRQFTGRSALGQGWALPGIVSFIKQVADALQYAHSRKIIHRDIKPDNILLKSETEALLSDFGIAVAMQSAQIGLLDVAGTVDYTAPEQLEGRPCAASDQYALGIVAYEWLTGERPFQGSIAELYLQHKAVPPPPLRSKAARVPPAVEQVVLKALAKDPRQRFASVRAFADALEQATHEPATAPFSMPTAPVGQGHGAGGEQPWNVPYARNPYFTGREAILALLHDVLAAGRVAELTQPQAMSGLGGIGKTQTAVEYAYRYCQDYEAVLWVRAETREALIADCIALARLLDLPEKDEPDTARVLAALKSWLETHSRWLLILDNVEDLATIKEVLPRRGSVLVTTRSQLTGALARRIDLEEMQAEEGALFLLRRIHLVDAETAYGAADAAERLTAREISELLAGLPLALDQAGAYIEETGCGLSGYLSLYLARRSAMLDWHRPSRSDHPESVATTWSLSFERVEAANPTAAALLRACAFLAPDAIPEEIITSGAPDLGSPLALCAADPLELEETVRELRRYSLLKRDPGAKLLMVHRLVQAVLRETMPREEQRVWAERVVRAVNRAFPQAYDDVGQWPLCERNLAQAQACAVLVEEYDLAFPEAAALVYRAGNYLLDHAQWTMAESFLQKALGVRTLLLGAEHADVAECLNDLAVLYMQQKDYHKAEPLLRRSLAIYEQHLGPSDHIVAVAINNIAMLLFYLGSYGEAETLYRRSMAIWEQRGWPEHPDVARCLNNLALLYATQKNYQQAEPLYQRSLALWERIGGPKHPDVARCLNNLARLYAEQGDGAEAEPRFLRARAMREQLLGPDHPDVAQTLGDLACLYTRQARFAEAEDLFLFALEILEQALGTEHPDVADVLEHYADLLAQTNRTGEVRDPNGRAKAIRTKQSA